MFYLNKFLIFIMAPVFILGVGATFAQEETSMPQVTVSEEAVAAANLDENVQSSDLGIGEPRLLPDSPFYFLKNWARAVQETFTFNSVKKAELKLKFANEKLMEAKKIISKTQNQEIIKKAVENYQQAIEGIANKAEEIKEKAGENPEVDKFLTKFTDHQILHQKLLQKLEEQVPLQVIEKIEEVRENHLEKFQEVMLKLENKEGVSEKLEEVLETQKGSQFKEFKNLEVLKSIEEKVPEEAKESIQKVEVNVLEKLKDKLEAMNLKDQEKFNEYLKQISGDKEKQLQIMENLKIQLKEATVTSETTKLKEKLEEGKTNILEKIEQKLEKINCPAWPSSAVECEKGILTVEKDENGCPLPPKCITAAEKCDTLITCQSGYTVYDTGLKDSNSCPIKKCVKKGETNVSSTEVKPTEKACITLWDPVCGKDGKTYSNSCFAEADGVEIDYNGACKDLSCKNLWWFDNEHNYCQQQSFCGTFMYLGLRTFETKEKCEAALQE